MLFFISSSYSTHPILNASYLLSSSFMSFSKPSQFGVRELCHALSVPRSHYACKSISCLDATCITCVPARSCTLTVHELQNVLRNTNRGFVSSDYCIAADLVMQCHVASVLSQIAGWLVEMRKVSPKWKYSRLRDNFIGSCYLRVVHRLSLWPIHLVWYTSPSGSITFGVTDTLSLIFVYMQGVIAGLENVEVLTIPPSHRPSHYMKMSCWWE